MSVPRAVVFMAVAWFGSAIVTFAVLALRGERSSSSERPPVAFSEFLALVDRGDVSEIHVKGRVATFVVVNEVNPKIRAEKRTVGPVEDEAQVRALRPSRAD